MKDNPDKRKEDVNSYLKYSGIGFQLAGSIGLGVFIGYWLDKWANTSGPYFTVAFSFIFLIAGFYLAFKDLLKNK